MTEAIAASNRNREQFVAALTDVALEVAAGHGVRGSSVDYEVDLWKALSHVVRGRPVEHDQFVGALTDAAYRVTLQHGFRGSFLDMQLDLWKALCRTARGSRPRPAVDSDMPLLVTSGAVA
jgi:hypothetical protein